MALGPEIYSDSAFTLIVCIRVSYCSVDGKSYVVVSLVTVASGNVHSLNSLIAEGSKIVACILPLFF